MEEKARYGEGLEEKARYGEGLEEKARYGEGLKQRVDELIPSVAYRSLGMK